MSRRQILLGVSAVIAAEAMVLLCLPIATAALRSRNRQRLAFLSSSAIGRLQVSDRMLPASTGTRYKFQLKYPGLVSQPATGPAALKKSLADLQKTLATASTDEAGLLLASTFGFDNTQRVSDEDKAIAALWGCEACRAPRLIGDHVEAYFEAARRAELTGSPMEAKRLYARYLALARQHDISALRDSRRELQARLTDAQIRVHTLAAQHTFMTPQLATLWSGDDVAAAKLLGNSDSGIRALAVFTTAALLFRRNEFQRSADLLTNRAAECGPLAAECGFLEMKVLWSAKGRTLSESSSTLPVRDEISGRLRKLIAALPPDHYLVDDMYLTLAGVSAWAGDYKGAIQTLDEAEQKFARTDRWVEIQRDRDIYRIQGGLFGDRR